MNVPRETDPPIMNFFNEKDVASLALMVSAWLRALASSPGVGAIRTSNFWNDCGTLMKPSPSVASDSSESVLNAEFLERIVERCRRLALFQSGLHFHVNLEVI